MRIPSRKLTYPTLANKCKSSSNVPFRSDILVLWRVERNYTIDLDMIEIFLRSPLQTMLINSEIFQKRLNMSEYGKRNVHIFIYIIHIIYICAWKRLLNYHLMYFLHNSQHQKKSLLCLRSQRQPSLPLASTNKGVKSYLATAWFTMGPVSIFVRPEKTWQDFSNGFSVDAEKKLGTNRCGENKKKWRLFFFDSKEFGPTPGVKKRHERLSGWWLNQPSWKICSSNWIISPNRDENKTYLKPPTRL